MWLNVAAAALVAGLATAVTLAVAMNYTIDAAAAWAAVVAALAGLVTALGRWVVGQAVDPPQRRRALSAFGAASLTVILVGAAAVWWFRPEISPAPDAPCVRAAGELRILTGRSLYTDTKLKGILDGAEAAVGVRVRPTEQKGTLDAAKRILGSDLSSEFDAFWLPSNKYLLLHGDQAANKVEGPGVSIATSPVVLGVRKEIVQELGSSPSWATIADMAARGKFTYGLTNPANSNSGLAALLAINSATKSDGRLIEGFFKGQAITAPSTGELSQLYRRRAEIQSPVDGLVSYESEILDINEEVSDTLKMEIVYPSDGTMTADFPLTLLKSASASARDRFEALVCYLKSKPVQAEIAGTHRRPLSTPANTAELPFLISTTEVENLLFEFHKNYQKLTRTIYVLDTSKSMWLSPTAKTGDPYAPAGQRRFDLMVNAFKALTGADRSMPFAEQAAKFSEREEIILLPFDTQVYPEIRRDLNENDGMQRILADVEGLQVHDDTAMYDALKKAYEVAGKYKGDGRITNVVVLTDGQSNKGLSYRDFENFYRGLKEDNQLEYTVRTFTIALGEAELEDLRGIANLTGGGFFNARIDPLTKVFFDIRGNA